MESGFEFFLGTLKLFTLVLAHYIFCCSNRKYCIHAYCRSVGYVYVHSESGVYTHDAHVESAAARWAPGRSASRAEGDRRCRWRTRDQVERPDRAEVHATGDERDPPLRVDSPGDRHERRRARRVARLPAAGRHAGGHCGVRGAPRPGRLEGPAPLQSGRQLPTGRPGSTGPRGGTYGGVRVRATSVSRRSARASGAAAVPRRHPAEVRPRAA